MEKVNARFASPQYSPRRVVRLQMDTSDKIDEGYSEETRSQEGMDSPMRIDFQDGHPLGSQIATAEDLQDAVLALPESERKLFAYNVLRSLRASSIAAVVDQLWPLFHKDPVVHFPPEIMSQIFSYLDPLNLVQAAQVSKTWRSRIFDGRLWKVKFLREGWGLDVEEIDRYERNYNLQQSLAPGNLNQGSRSFTTSAILQSKKAHKQQNRDTQRQDGISNLGEQSSPSGRPGNTDSALKKMATKGMDEEMPDADSVHPEDHDRAMLDPSQPTQDQKLQEASVAGSNSNASSPLAEPDTGAAVEKRSNRTNSSENSLILPISTGYSRLNYHYIYKQKRKLEDNWNAGRYKNFQLPHRDHPEDAHTECVYTIQYLGKYLVSGSRDQTLRIWDLDTQRLVRKPLHGHTGSVLCLQFDDSQEEDIIVSGSSDTNVILWRFSTGKMILQLTNAHKESVLNLRFDKRFLVTCSKDKTIKIWNRDKLKAGDRNYPIKGVKGGGQCPSYIIDFAGIAGALRYGPSKSEHRIVLEPYTHLMTLDLHGAAVNAIQIYEDQLVSASGDRCLRVWNIHTGECTTKIEAHSKGIACVQYDGKRIVSGSSDNTIRIWDPISHVEVARLEGHGRLVRTIQAAFADVPGGREGLQEEAAEVDRQWRIAKEAGKIIQPARGAPKPIPGSRRPNDLRGINAKIPPSGGGGRWSHIVSGSYDETVLVWKKTEDDEWVVGLKLRQEEALTAAGPELPSRSEQAQAEGALEQPSLAPPTVPPAGIAQQGVAQASNAAHTNQATHRSTAASTPHGTNDRPGQGPSLLPTARSSQAQSNLTAGLGLNTMPAPSGIQALPGPNHPNPQNFLPGLRTRFHPTTQSPPTGQPNARVFKLQFDARRIICCSQDPKIVGWDFANGQEDIIECSRFFAAPQ